jgi:hypothetical protein
MTETVPGRVFLDAAYTIALVNKDDALHEIAVDIHFEQAAREFDPPFGAIKVLPPLWKTANPGSPRRLNIWAP